MRKNDIVVFCDDASVIEDMFKSNFQFNDDISSNEKFRILETYKENLKMISLSSSRVFNIKSSWVEVTKEHLSSKYGYGEEDFSLFQVYTELSEK